MSFRLMACVGLASVLLSCSKSSSGPTAKIATNFKVAHTSRYSQELIDAISIDKFLPWLAAPRAAQNVAAFGTSLQSLQYFITSITICQSATFSGSAFSGQTGCIKLYEGPTNADLSGIAIPDIPTTPGIVRSRNITTGFIDLIDATSRAQLNQSVSVTSEQAGDYTVGFINWYPPIKVKGTLMVPGTSTGVLYTHDGTTQTATTNGVSFSPTVSATSLTTPGAETAIVALSNGGNFFKFQRPFTITAADIAAGSTFGLDLTFNPDGIVQGVTAPGATNFPPLVDNAVGPPTLPGYNSIFVPILQLTPVPHKTTSHVIRETYTGRVDLDGPTSRTVRLELYYLNDDTTKTIYGMNDTYLPNASTTDYIAGSPYVNSIFTETDGSLTFKDYAGVAVFDTFTRKTTVGETTSMHVICSGTGGGIGPSGTDSHCTGTTTKFQNVTMTLVASDDIDAR